MPPTVNALLDEIAGAARRVVHARYAAIAMLDDRHEEIATFVQDGVDAATAGRMAGPPTGSGLLGWVIREGRPVRIEDIRAHPGSQGFPPGHPEMRSFLGVPIMLDGEALGALYFADKSAGNFTAEDEAAAGNLAQWAAVALANATTMERIDRERAALAEASEAQEALIEVTAAVTTGHELGSVLQLLAERSRALARAVGAAIGTLDGGHVVISAISGALGSVRLGTRLPPEGTLTNAALQSWSPVTAGPGDPHAAVFEQILGPQPFRSVTAFPMVHRRQPMGAIILLDGDALDRRAGLMQSFAAAAAQAVAGARRQSTGRATVRAHERERAQWATELHDKTLQPLAAMMLDLATIRDRAEDETARQAANRAIDQARSQIVTLRGLAGELRPSGLDDLGLAAAITDLADRIGADNDIVVHTSVQLRPDQGQEPTRLTPEVTTTAYRVVDEALTNSVRHSGANTITIAIREDELLTVEISDDGCGFDPLAPADGLGLSSLRERAELLGGSLEIRSDGGGTTIRAVLPVMPTSQTAAPLEVPDA